MNHFFCANLSRESGEDIVGSAPPLLTYIFVECPYPWASQALESKSVPPNLRALAERLQQSEVPVKLLLILGDPPHPHHGTRAIVYQQQTELSDGYAKQEFEVASISQIAPLIEQYLSDRASVAHLSQPESPPTRDYFICTHGSHDKCCARYGYPFYRAARKRVADLGLKDVRVWQVSHIGGHRFAPTLISLPDGRYYGALDEQSFASIVQRQGDIHCFERVYRGWGRLPRKVQVLERELILMHGWSWFENRVSCQILKESDDGRSTIVQLTIGKPHGSEIAYQATIVEDERRTLCLRGSCGSEKVSQFPKYAVQELHCLDPGRPQPSPLSSLGQTVVPTAMAKFEIASNRLPF